ncbi:DHHA1 domain-containing protein [Cytobacillus spongiae]|uniref:DHH family phosphoesterase n=1 Tax=Cytobacillus spongiae TaxID=2901381 RepID=UPI001F430937|nr:DHHA1 domain-containing protein [Cytobacillus spongiae]UII54289.1 DHHA1 domain-containing protein [Cytobacillus spongiae]
MYKLFTHNDLDGVGCGIIAKIAFGEKADVKYNSVLGLDVQLKRYLENVSAKQKEENAVIITDLSINEENTSKVEQYYRSGGKVNLIDHHKSALQYNEYDWGHVQVAYDDNRLTSATSLLYDYLIQEGHLKPSNALHEFVELIRLYDTWEWDQNQNTKAKQLNDLFYLLSIDDFEAEMVDRLRTGVHFEFTEFEQQLLKMEEKKIERYIRRKKREMIQSFIGVYCVGIVHAESYHSELGNALGTEYPYIDYIAILNMSGKKISLRTIHDHIDVSVIAETFGGGGHAKAAGCSLNEEAFSHFVSNVFPIEPMKQDASRNHFNMKNSLSGSLYMNRSNETFFLYANGEKQWVIEKCHDLLDHTFQSFQEAEMVVKRHHSAWLVPDDMFIHFLQAFMMDAKRKE